MAPRTAESELSVYSTASARRCGVCAGESGVYPSIVNYDGYLQAARTGTDDT